MSLKLVTAASTYPVTLAEAKLHLRVDSTDEDTLITALITAATEMCEQATGRALMTQTWELTQDAFDDQMILTRVPVQSITSVSYLNESGNLIVLDPLAYDLYNADDYGYASVTPVYGTFWPATREHNEAVAVRYVAGYANAAAVPQPIKQWVLLMIASMFDNRETEAYSSRAVSTTVRMQFVDRLLDRYQVFSL
jgi:uncharacterized phiE125 gp8 family phage protein